MSSLEIYCKMHTPFFKKVLIILRYSTKHDNFWLRVQFPLKLYFLSSFSNFADSQLPNQLPVKDFYNVQRYQHYEIYTLQKLSVNFEMHGKTQSWGKNSTI